MDIVDIASIAPPFDLRALRRPIPSIIFQAEILTLGESVKEGALVQAVGPAWFEIVKLLRTDPETAFKTDPRKWEEIIAGAYDRAGFEVTLTPRSGDHGADVIAVKRGRFSMRIIDQVKAYRRGHRVKADDVRALIGRLSSDLGATKGIVTTTSDFAPMIQEDPFIKPLIPFRLELVNGERLAEWLNGLAIGDTSQEIASFEGS